MTRILRFKVTNTLTEIMSYRDVNRTNPASLIILWCLFIARLQKIRQILVKEVT